MKLRELAVMIKNAVTMEQVISAYLPAEQIRKGFIACPFHGEKVGSMKLYEGSFYCFGCHAHGDLLDFVGKFFGISPMAAASRLNDDFDLQLPVSGGSMAQRISAKRRAAELTNAREQARKTRQKRSDAYSEAVDRWTSMAIQMRDNAPTDRDAPYPAAWVEAARKIDLAAYELDCAELPGGRWINAESCGNQHDGYRPTLRLGSEYV